MKADRLSLIILSSKKVQFLNGKKENKVQKIFAVTKIKLTLIELFCNFRTQF